MKVGIVGNNVSAITLAKRLRDRDPSAEIVVFSKESFPYYQRPKLIDLLAGECEEKDIYFYPPAWYEKNRIDVRLSDPVLSVDPGSMTLKTASGEIKADRIVIASGASSFVPPIPGSGLGGVFCHRTLDDCRAIKSAAAASTNTVIIGGGVLGLETAGAIRKLNPNATVTVLEVMPWLLPRQLDPEGAAVLVSLLAARGIPVRTGVAIKGLLGGKKVGEIDLGGERLPADLVVVSAGVRPELGFLASSGLAIKKGVVVDDFLETSSRGIFCLGDAAEHRGTVYGIIKPAIDMADVAASNILAAGSKEYRGSLVSRNTKILDSYLLSVGDFSPADEKDCRVVRVVEKSEYRKFTVRGNSLVGLLSIGRRLPEMKVQQMIGSKTDISSILDKMRSLDYNFS